MNKSILTAVAGVLLLSIAAPIAADYFAPSHSCRKPFKPYQFTNQWELDNFNDEVRRFRRCIENFVEDQKSEAENHLQAADNAVDDWNRFVRYELN